MKLTGLRLVARLVLLASCAVAVGSVGQAAARTESRESVVNFVNLIAKDTYNLAWPTATYRTWSLLDLRAVDGGYDVVVKLSGLSAFDGSDLWFTFAFQVGGGGLSNPRVLRHNALIMPPFGAMKLTAAVAADLARQYAQSQRASVAAPAPDSAAGAVCISNATGAALPIMYRWGNQSWQQRSLPAGQAYKFWWPYGAGQPASPEFTIEYDDNYAEGYTPQQYVLERRAAALPVRCEDAMQYRFSTDGARITLVKVN